MGNVYASGTLPGRGRRQKKNALCWRPGMSAVAFRSSKRTRVAWRRGTLPTEASVLLGLLGPMKRCRSVGKSQRERMATVINWTSRGASKQGI